MIADPWRAFEEALVREGVSADDFRSILDALQQTAMGTSAQRQELRAIVYATLASMGEASLGEAEREASKAWKVGASGWVGLHLAAAAIEKGDPKSALAALEKVAPGYFDDAGLHDRTVELKYFEVYALLGVGDRERAHLVIQDLNGELASRSLDDMFPSPVHLATQLLEAGPPYDLLEDLVRGYDLTVFPGGPELAPKVAKAIRADTCPVHRPSSD